MKVDNMTVVHLQPEPVHLPSSTAKYVVLALTGVPLVLVLAGCVLFTLSYFKKTDDPATAPGGQDPASGRNTRTASTVPNQDNQVYRSQSLDKYNMTEEIVAELMKYQSRESTKANTPVVRLIKVRPSNASINASSSLQATPVPSISYPPETDDQEYGHNVDEVVNI